MVSGCKKKVDSTEPVIVAFQDTIFSNIGGKYIFKVSPRTQWTTRIQTFRQTYELKNNILDSEMSIRVRLEDKFNEGDATLILSNGSHNYFYKLYLKNNYQKTNWKKFDFRSPKTVNTDSVLQHQSLLFYLDTLQNILMSDTQPYFPTQTVQLSPQTNKIQAIANQALTTYYITPGSPANIYLSMTYNEENNTHEIKSNVIMDKYKNVIADGTEVIFTMSKNGKIKTISTQTRGGVAMIEMALSEYEGCEIGASILFTKSNLLKTAI